MPTSQSRTRQTARAASSGAALRWTDAAWLAEATAWIEGETRRLGAELSGDISQPHVFAWSTVLRVPTRDGVLWFKAAAPVHAFEGSVVELLATRHPERVTELLASDHRRGWMLMADAGVRLREVVREEGGLDPWLEVLPLYAQLQIDAAADVERLLTAGAPDQRLEMLPQAFVLVLADDDLLRVGLADGLTADEHERLHDVAAGLPATCAELAAFGLPETIQHDDLHDGQVFVRDGRYRFLDWGDSCVSHPFFTLTVTLRAISARFELQPAAPELTRLRDVYLEPWTVFAPRRDLVPAAELARRVGQVCRALSWHRFTSCYGRDPRESEGVPWSLRLVIDPEAWRDATD